MLPDRVSGVTSPLGLRVRQLREQRGLTQDELQERAGIATGYVSKLENKGIPKHPGDKVLSGLARALGVTVAELTATPARTVVEDDPYPTRAQAIEMLRDDERISAGTLRALRLVQREDGRDPGRVEWLKLAREIEQEARAERAARDKMFDARPGRKA
jgi:transcriptional regulator with XRE-family HTH domain